MEAGIFATWPRYQNRVFRNVSLWNKEDGESNFVSDQPHGLVVRVSDYWSWGPGVNSQFYHGDFSLKGKILMVTVVCVV
jgi:uncharacterized heparinase superfamily protein